MTRRSKLWRIGAAVWIIINGAGALYAAAMGEGMHAAVHVVLLVVGIAAYATWRPRPESEKEDMAAVSEANDRVQHLEQSLNSIALNVERIGEAQRFERKILEERAEVSPPKKEE
jgi:hypothetical protein